MKLSQLVTSAFIRVLNKLWLAGFALVLSSSLNAQELSKLPYVPTPQIVVDEMLKLAGVTAKDFVIDLGSGDGRMIITAARNFQRQRRRRRHRCEASELVQQTGDVRRRRRSR